MLYSEKIMVTCHGEDENEPFKPAFFTWNNEEFHITEILKSWQDWGFPAGAPRKKNWRLRRHRNYYRVRTESGRVFEIYLDRKTPEPTWVLYRELEA